MGIHVSILVSIHESIQGEAAMAVSLFTARSSSHMWQVGLTSDRSCLQDALALYTKSRMHFQESFIAGVSILLLAMAR
jgi:hypothetical protein